jgi:hypothetical protein
VLGGVTQAGDIGVACAMQYDWKFNDAGKAGDWRRASFLRRHQTLLTMQDAHVLVIHNAVRRKRHEFHRALALLRGARGLKVVFLQNCSATYTAS